MKRLLDKVYSLTDINKITDLISSFLKKPVIIEDQQFSLLAYSSYYIDQFDEVNKLTIFSKRWPKNVAEAFMEEGIVEKIMTSTSPVRIAPMKKIGLNQRIVIKIHYKQFTYGYLWVQETNANLTEQELQFVIEVSKHIGQLLYESGQNKINRVENRNEFFKKIIEDYYTTEEQIRWEAANLNISLPKQFILTVFTINQEELFDELLNRIQITTNVYTLPVHIFIDSLKIIVVILGDHFTNASLSECVSTLIDSIINQFNQFTIYVGVSNEYSSPLMLKKSYDEALEVIKTAKFIGVSQLPSVEYKNLGIFRYLEPIFKYYGKNGATNEKLLLLKKKDEESQTSLLKTLEVYLLNNCRLKPTAEQLFIHVNTLKYRLNQITEITSLTFDDFLTNCQLFIDIQLLKTMAK